MSLQRNESHSRALRTAAPRQLPSGWDSCDFPSLGHDGHDDPTLAQMLPNLGADPRHAAARVAPRRRTEPGETSLGVRRDTGGRDRFPPAPSVLFRGRGRLARTTLPVAQLLPRLAVEQPHGITPGVWRQVAVAQGHLDRAVTWPLFGGLWKPWRPFFSWAWPTLQRPSNRDPPGGALLIHPSA